jgi:AcrR family transcriptional regulator
MARPSLAAERREQILDGVERCIIKHGLANVTYERIAEEARVQPTLIPHYFGNKQAVMSAAVERTLANVLGLVDEVVGEAHGRERIDRLIELVFSGALAIPQVGQLADELIAVSYFDEETRLRIFEMYRHLERVAVDAVRGAYPDVPRPEADAVAYALLCLADANNTFSCIGFPPRYHARARAAAETLLRTLDDREHEAATRSST